MPAVPLPEAFVTRVRHRLGPEADAYLAALGRPPAVGVRLHGAKGVRAPVAATPVPWHPRGYTLPARPNFTLDPLLHAGAYYVQEPSSMAVYAALATVQRSARPLRILDVCAAPGGKSTLLADWKRPADLLLANEVVPARRATLLENLRKWGAPGCYVGGTAAEDLPGRGQWDVVLVDAPCSGEGMFRRDAFAREQWSPRLVAECAALQRTVLTQAAATLAPGGTLIFSTCTGAPEENVGNAGQLLRDRRDLSEMPLPALADAGWRREGVGYQALPHRLAGEGLYLSCLRKDGVPPDEPLRLLRRTRRDHECETALKQTADLQLADGLELYRDRDRVTAEYPAHRAFWRTPHQSGAQPAEAVGAIAAFKGDTAVPTAAMALATYLHGDEAADLSVDRRTALRLLGGEAPPEANAGARGWRRVTYRGVGLTWTKQLGRRYNVAWPKPWRIRQRLPPALPGWEIGGEDAP